MRAENDMARMDSTGKKDWSSWSEREIALPKLAGLLGQDKELGPTLVIIGSNVAPGIVGSRPISSFFPFVFLGHTQHCSVLGELYRVPETEPEVGRMQGKCHTCCTITLALTSPSYDDLLSIPHLPTPALLCFKVFEVAL